MSAAYCFTAQSRRSRHASHIARQHLPIKKSCAGLAAVKAATRRLRRWPAASLDRGCDPAQRLAIRDERTITSTSRSMPTTEEKACLDRSRLLTTMSPYKPGWSEAQIRGRHHVSSRISPRGIRATMLANVMEERTRASRRMDTTHGTRGHPSRRALRRAHSEPVKNTDLLLVIPGCALAQAGIHTPCRGYGFRARSFHSRPE